MTHTFNLNGRTIRIIVSQGGVKYKRATGLTIDPRLWNQKAKSLPAKCQDRKVWAELRLINARMEEKEGEGCIDMAEAVSYALGGRSVAKSPEIAREKKAGGAQTFYEYFEEWAGRDTPQRRQRKNALKLVRGCMGDGYDWKDIDTAFYFRLIQKLKDKDYSVNYIGSVVKKLKTVMSEGHKLKYHTNTDYHQFKSPMEQTDAVYLTKPEVDRLWGLDLDDDTERKTRDLFLLGCYTAMRFSDYSRLSEDNIRNGMIYMTQRKTAGRVVVPASPKVIAILKRNGGAAPKMPQAVLNRVIKVVCFKARIFDKIEVTKSRGGRHETSMKEKYELVSSHTARRTAATLLYQSGVSAAQVMQITGHKTEAEFYKYIRTTKEENAEALKDNPFFK